MYFADFISWLLMQIKHCQIVLFDLPNPTKGSSMYYVITFLDLFDNPPP